MVNILNMNNSPLAAGKYDKSTKRSTQQRHRANAGKSRFEPEWGWALRALRSLQSKQMVEAMKLRDTHFLTYNDKEKWIEH